MTPLELREAYRRGENVAGLLRRAQGCSTNSERMIEAAYDLQAGTYVEAARRPGHAAYLAAYSQTLAELIVRLGGVSSLLEAGVGEATTFSHVLEALAKAGGPVAEAHGIDLSWSRLDVARAWLAERGGGAPVTLCVASLFELPYAENSFDIVYTSHSLEPNRGREREALAELHRVASRYVILLEPGYELASPEARARMDAHGYVTGIPDHARALGFVVLEHRLFEHTANPLNPTALTILEKNPSATSAHPVLACPLHHCLLRRRGDHYFSPTGLAAYPVLGGIPCLRSEFAIPASRLETAS